MERHHTLTQDVLPPLRRLLQAVAMMLFAIIMTCQAMAQRTVDVVARYAYHAPRTLSLAEAELQALRLAQIQAIADEFGTTIVQSTAHWLSQDDSRTDSRFNALSFTDVKGEWIKTYGKPQYSYENDGNELLVSVVVKGRIREIKYMKPQFQCKLLRNATTDQAEADEWRDGDKLYASFRSSAEGYLAIFSKEDSVRCLWPAVSVKSGLFEVNANRVYLLFDQPGQRIEMCCSGTREINAIYTVFSPNPVACPVAHTIDSGGLPVYTADEFQRWLAEARSKDNSLQVEVKYITITK